MTTGNLESTRLESRGELAVAEDHCAHVNDEWLDAVLDWDELEGERVVESNSLLDR